MISEVITVEPSDVASLEPRVAEALSAELTPDLYGPNSHLRTPDGGRLYLRKSGDAVVIGLASDLAEAEHNGWAADVFGTLCVITPGDIQMFDEDDNVVRSRHTAAA
ncbi:MAG: hypothetical protein QM662_04910 [Gordonia sp. (in: high G+C Gram-positive bacteria)]